MYHIGRFIFWIYFHLFYRLEIIGAENMPKNGSVILCSNHISVLDPLVLSICFKRPINFMAKSELFSNKFFSWILKSLKAFPVNRNTTDLKAYKTVVAFLKNNQIIGIFIQGKRTISDDDISAKSGASMFALKCRVPIMPVGISSSYKLFSKVVINIGSCIYFEDFYTQRVNSELLSEVTGEIVSNLNSLLKGQSPHA